MTPSAMSYEPRNERISGPDTRLCRWRCRIVCLICVTMGWLGRQANVIHSTPGAQSDCPQSGNCRNYRLLAFPNTATILSRYNQDYTNPRPDEPITEQFGKSGCTVTPPVEDTQLNPGIRSAYPSDVGGCPKLLAYHYSHWSSRVVNSYTPAGR